MNGRRLPDSPNGDGVIYRPGDYARIGGTWYGSTPTGQMANLANHTIVEHEDGTITVSPSIEVNRGKTGDRYWHGFLERGAWRKV